MPKFPLKKCNCLKPSFSGKNMGGHYQCVKCNGIADKKQKYKLDYPPKKVKL